LFELRPGFEGPDPHTHDDHVDSFYVLEGEVEFLVAGETVHAGPGTFVAAPPGVVHTFVRPGADIQDVRALPARPSALTGRAAGIHHDGH
jgi:quercetin dioxygenase-like cupin family protein